jgi:hypothetical protein
VLEAATEWAGGVFTRATTQSVVAHLGREAAELAEHPDDQEEMADVAILAHQALAFVYWHADRRGIDLTDAVAAKFAKNRSRRWGKPDSEGVVEHINDDHLERC